MSQISKHADRPIYAAIDLGSNSFRLLIAECINQKLCILHEDRVRVQLARDMDQDSNLNPSAIKRGMIALKRFQEKIDIYKVSKVRAVATNAMRLAKNADLFLQTVASVFHTPIEVISGEEEARLIYYGVTQGFEESDSKHFVIDIGGGSTELIIGRDKEALKLVSLPMGCISFQKQFFDEVVIHERYFEQAHEAGKNILAPYVSAFKELGWQDVYGCSGTIGAVWGVMNHFGFQENIVTLEAIERIMCELVRLGCYDHLQRLGISKDRKMIFPGGLAILHAIFTMFDLQAVTLSTAALRDGVLYHLAS